MARQTMYTLAVLMALCFSQAQAANPRDFGAVGDGVTDDTAAIQKTVDETTTGRVYFQKGLYRITQTIAIPLEKGVVNLEGPGGGAQVRMEGAGPAFLFTGNHRGTAAPESFNEPVSMMERMPCVSGIEIVGNHPEADGIAFSGTVQATMRGVLIRETRHGLHFIGRNRNVLVEGCHIYNCAGVGVFFDAVNLHQANVIGCHISYCKGGGVRVLGGEVRNFQITGNDIEYNYDTDAEASADVWIDAADGSIEEGTISSNTIQARPSPNGANIRFEAPFKPEERGRIGLWTISGNLIGSQTVNIHLVNVTGMAVTGNHIYSGVEHALRLDGARHIVISGNSLDQDHNRGLDLGNGIHIENCDGTLLQGNLLSDAFAGSPERGGAISIVNSRETLVANCQIFEPRHRGVHVEDSRNTRITDCQILVRNGGSTMQTPLEITGESPGTIVRGISYHPGLQGGILAPEDASVQDAIPAAPALAPTAE